LITTLIKNGQAWILVASYHLKCKIEKPSRPQVSRKFALGQLKSSPPQGQNGPLFAWNFVNSILKQILQSVFFFPFFFVAVVSTGVTYCLRLSKITSRMVLRSRVVFALTLLHNSMSMSLRMESTRSPLPLRFGLLPHQRNWER